MPDIPTHTLAASDLPEIRSLADLTHAVHQIAQDTLVIDAAKNHMQAEVEAIKKAFEEGTAPNDARRLRYVAAVENYCHAHKDELFPVKNGKRQKTFAVLQHKLQFRESSEVTREHPEFLKDTDIARNLADAVRESKDPEFINAVSQCVRVSDPTLDKPAIRKLWPAIGHYLKHAHGLILRRVETFKIELNFTPSDN